MSTASVSISKSGRFGIQFDITPIMKRTAIILNIAVRFFSVYNRSSRALIKRKKV